MKELRDEIRRSIKYFTQFEYAPSSDEVYAFLKLRISRNRLENELEKMVQEGSLVEKSFKMANFRYLASEKEKLRDLLKNKDLHKSLYKYTLPEYSRLLRNQSRRSQISSLKLKKADYYIRLTSSLSQIKLVGLSGSLAMLNAKSTDDIDLFVITAKNRLWTARFLTNFIAALSGLKRARGIKKANNKICLNLFFDEKQLTVPKSKQNYYVAHEILQMRPIVAKDGIYRRFLIANKWIFKIFPNALNELRNVDYGLIRNSLYSRLNIPIIGDIIEIMLKKAQFLLINRHKTTELVTDTQLWFFPDDFEKKVKI